MIVSPTTFMATLHTMRAVMRDAQMREQAHVIQKEVALLGEDVVRLDDRVGKLQRHFDQASEDVRQIRISTEKVKNRSDRIIEAELEDGDVELAPAAQPKRLSVVE
jgi:DNA recombination protein RmuC